MRACVCGGGGDVLRSHLGGAALQRRRLGAPDCQQPDWLHHTSHQRPFRPVLVRHWQDGQRARGARECGPARGAPARGGSERGPSSEFATVRAHPGPKEGSNAFRRAAFAERRVCSAHCECVPARVPPRCYHGPDRLPSVGPQRAGRAGVHAAHHVPRDPHAQDRSHALRGEGASAGADGRSAAPSPAAVAGSLTPRAHTHAIRPAPTSCWPRAYCPARRLPRPFARTIGRCSISTRTAARRTSLRRHTSRVRTAISRPVAVIALCRVR